MSLILLLTLTGYLYAHLYRNDRRCQSRFQVSQSGICRNYNFTTLFISRSLTYKLPVGHPIWYLCTQWHDTQLDDLIINSKSTQPVCLSLTTQTKLKVIILHYVHISVHIVHLKAKSHTYTRSVVRQHIFKSLQYYISSSSYHTHYYKIKF